VYQLWVKINDEEILVVRTDNLETVLSEIQKALQRKEVTECLVAKELDSL